MPDHQPEQSSFIIKGALYVFGILLGLGAKLALIHKEKPLTVKDFVLHSSIAFACAWLVWAILEHYGKLDLANIASVIVGRYADYVLVAIWKAIRNMLKTDKP